MTNNTLKRRRASVSFIDIFITSLPILTPRCQENCTLLRRMCHLASFVWRDTCPINVASSIFESRANSIRLMEWQTRSFQDKGSLPGSDRYHLKMTCWYGMALPRLPDSLLEKEGCLLSRSSLERCKDVRLGDFGLEERHKVSADKLFGRLGAVRPKRKSK